MSINVSVFLKKLRLFSSPNANTPIFLLILGFKRYISAVVSLWFLKKYKWKCKWFIEERAPLELNPILFKSNITLNHYKQIIQVFAKLYKLSQIYQYTVVIFYCKMEETNNDKS